MGLDALDRRSVFCVRVYAGRAWYIARIAQMLIKELKIFPLVPYSTVNYDHSYPSEHEEFRMLTGIATCPFASPVILTPGTHPLREF